MGSTVSSKTAWGIIALLREEFAQALALAEDEEAANAGEVTVATGVAAAPLLWELCKAAMARYPSCGARVVACGTTFLAKPSRWRGW